MSQQITISEASENQYVSGVTKGCLERYCRISNTFKNSCTCLQNLNFWTTWLPAYFA